MDVRGGWGVLGLNKDGLERKQLGEGGRCSDPIRTLFLFENFIEFFLLLTNAVDFGCSKPTTVGLFYFVCVSGTL